MTNHGESVKTRSGVHIFLDNFGTGRNIVVSGLYVHDVNGTNQIKDNGGIIFRTNGNKTPSRFDGLTVNGTSCGRWIAPRSRHRIITTRGAGDSRS